MTTSIQFYFTS